MSNAPRIEVGSPQMRAAFDRGLENYVPTCGGHEMEEEGGVTHITLHNLRELVDANGNPARLEVGEAQGMLVSWKPFEIYLATGFGIAYSGTGPTGLATFAAEVGWGEKEELRREISSLNSGFRGTLFPRELREDPPQKKLDAYQDIVTFARHLVEDELWTAEQLIHFLEKPWKWEPEYTAWKESQR